MKISTKQLKTLLKTKLSLVKALEKQNPDSYYTIGRPCYCPFHDNTDSPAAAIYENDGIESLYCFSERKLYTVVDVLAQNYDIYSIAQSLWAAMTPAEQEQFLALHPEDDFANAFSNVKTVEVSLELEKAKQLYKYNKISINTLLEEYIKIYT